MSVVTERVPPGSFDPFRLLGINAVRDPAEQYRKLRDHWLEETALCSRCEDLVESRNARKLRGLPDAPRFLARDLEAREEGAIALMALLRTILERGPTLPPEALGRRTLLRQSWLEWLRAEGIL